MGAAWFCFGSLLCDIAAHFIYGDVADAGDKIGPMPENRFPIEFSDVIGKAISYSSGTGRFEVIDQHRDIQDGVDVHQEMDVIFLAAEFKELAAPLCQDIGEGSFEILPHLFSEDLASVFGYKSYMQPKRINGI